MQMEKVTYRESGENNAEEESNQEAFEPHDQ
jgi:hypothetical protein